MYLIHTYTHTYTHIHTHTHTYTHMYIYTYFFFVGGGMFMCVYAVCTRVGGVVDMV